MGRQWKGSPVRGRVSRVALGAGIVALAAPAVARSEWVMVGRECATNAAGSLCVERQVDHDEQRMRGRWTVNVASGEWIEPNAGYLALSTRTGKMIGPCGSSMSGAELGCARLTASETGTWYEHRGKTAGVFGYTAQTSDGELRAAAGDTGWQAVARPRCRTLAAGRVCVNIGERFIGSRLRRRMDAATSPREGRWIAGRTMTLMVRQNRVGADWKVSRRVLCDTAVCARRERWKRGWHGVFIEDATRQGTVTIRVARFDYVTAAGAGSLEMVDK